MKRDRIIFKRSASRLMWAFAALAVISLLVPVVGPAVDHHYAERLPEHGHVYIGEVEPDHDHRYSADHSHDETTFIADDAGVVMIGTASSNTSSTKIVFMDRGRSDDENGPRFEPTRTGRPDNDSPPSQEFDSPEPFPPRA